MKLNSDFQIYYFVSFVEKIDKLYSMDNLVSCFQKNILVHFASLDLQMYYNEIY